MARPLSAAEKLQMAEFLGGLLRGRSELGIGSLGLVGIYTRARAEGLNIFDIALEDQATLDMFVEYLTRNMRRIPRGALAAIETALKQAQAPQMLRHHVPHQHVQHQHVPVTPFVDRDDP
jgi:hypothetical protein